MNPPLLDETWVRSGISLLWSAPQLADICTPDSIISIRQFLRLSEENWPESKLHLINGRTMVVAGLEACIDTVSPDSAVEWLESVLYKAMLSFQQRVADGGAEAPLARLGQEIIPTGERRYLPLALWDSVRRQLNCPRPLPLEWGTT